MHASDSITPRPEAPNATVLPFTPRLLSADLASCYLGISKTNLVDRVRSGELPQPRRIGARVLWDRHTLDLYIDALFGFEKAEAKEANDFGD